MARGGGVKIVSVRWARACVARGEIVPEDPYLIGPSPEYPDLPPLGRRGGRFAGWRCIVVLEDAKMRDV